jgi:hypothetical protein
LGWLVPDAAPRPEAASNGRNGCLELKFIQSLDDWMNFVNKKIGMRGRRIPILFFKPGL